MTPLAPIQGTAVRYVFAKDVLDAHSLVELADNVADLTLAALERSTKSIQYQSPW